MRNRADPLRFGRRGPPRSRQKPVGLFHECPRRRTGGRRDGKGRWVMTLLHKVRNGVPVPQVSLAAAEEGISPEKLRALIAAGKAGIPRNRKRKETRPL